MPARHCSWDPCTKPALHRQAPCKLRVPVTAPYNKAARACDMQSIQSVTAHTHAGATVQIETRVAAASLAVATVGALHCGGVADRRARCIANTGRYAPRSSASTIQRIDPCGGCGDIRKHAPAERYDPGLHDVAWLLPELVHVTMSALVTACTLPITKQPTLSHRRRP
jgi:hypothetical protein